MSVTVAEFNEAVTKWEEEAGLRTDLFMAVWDEMLDALPYIEGLGQLELAEKSGGEGDGAQIHVVLKVGEQYFQQDGYYSSWGSDEMDGEVYEVRPKQVQVTQYERV